IQAPSAPPAPPPNTTTLPATPTTTAPPTPRQTPGPAPSPAPADNSVLLVPHDASGVAWPANTDQIVPALSQPGSTIIDVGHMGFIKDPDGLRHTGAGVINMPGSLIDGAHLTVKEGVVSLQTPQAHISGRLAVTKEGQLRVENVDWHDTPKFVQALAGDPNKLLEPVNQQLSDAGVVVKNVTVTSGGRVHV